MARPLKSTFFFVASLGKILYSDVARDVVGVAEDDLELVGGRVEFRTGESIGGDHCTGTKNEEILLYSSANTENHYICLLGYMRMNTRIEHDIHDRVYTC